MIKRWMSKTALFALALACASTGARAEFIDFEDVAPALYPAPSSFATTANLGAGNIYTFNVNTGNAAVDKGAPGSNSDTACIANNGTGCSTNGTQALYVFSANGNGNVTLYPSAGNMISISSFSAAIATVNLFQLCDPADPGCLVPFLDFSLPSDILVTGQRNAGFGANPIPMDFALSSTFVTQTLIDFVNLDWVSFAYNGSAPVCVSNCTGDFAIDDLNATLTPAPTNPGPPTNNVPEPGTSGLLVTGLIGLGITRRRKQRSA
jgi:hypothetical protein